MNPRDSRKDGAPLSLRAAAMVAVPCILVGMAVGAAAALSKGHAAPRSAAATATRIDSDSLESQTPAAAGPAAAPGPAPATHLADDDLRALIREELAASAARSAALAAGGAGAAAATARDTQADRPLSNEEIKTYDRARATVDESIARGTWTKDDREELHFALATMPAERAMELVRPLLAAYNQGKVRFEGHGPLL
jgi:hypothetical protein